MLSLDKIVQYRSLTLLLGATFISTFWTIMLNHEEFSSTETLVFSLYIAGVTLLQLCVIAVFLLFAKVLPKLSILASIAGTLFTTFNIYTLIIVHNAHFISMNDAPLAGVIAALAAGIAMLFFIRNKQFVKFIHVFFLIMTGMIAIQFIGENKVYIKGLFDRIPSHFNFVEFEKKPNVYIVSLDALSPEAVAKKNIGVKNVPYADAFRRHNMRIIPNSFSERIPTKRALNLLLAMDKDYFYGVSEDAGFVRNQVPNPTYEIFRRNGYKIQFIYGSSYFGDDRGRLDYYGIAKAYGACKHVERKYGFMGYCLETVQEKTKEFTKIHEYEYPQMLFDRIKETANSDEQWFTFASVYKPGHAKNSTKYNKPEDWDEYRALFKKNSSEVVKTIDTLLNTIKENDPNSITIIFGDHGALLTLGALNDYDGIAADATAFNLDDFPEDSPVSFEQVVQDRHGVLTALMPADACSSQFKHNPYSTMRLMRDLAICLSGGKDPLPNNFQPDDDHWKPYVFE